MANRKIVYQNWIVDIGIDPGQIGNCRILSDKIEPNQKVVAAVRQTLKKLNRNERIFIEKYYFQGQTYLEISKLLDKRLSLIEGLHRRSISKLKKQLARFVEEYYGYKVDIGHECIICLSPFRDKIENLIRSKNKCDTWKEIIKKSKVDYQLIIKTPQILIGHLKYHMEQGD